MTDMNEKLYFVGFPYGPFSYTETRLIAEVRKAYSELSSRFFAYPVNDVFKLIEADSGLSSSVKDQPNPETLNEMMREYFIQWMMKTMIEKFHPVEDVAIYFLLDEFERAMTGIQKTDTSD